MRGVSFAGDRKIAFIDVPDPTPGPSEVVLEIKASGMCGSDLKFYRAPSGAGAPDCGTGSSGRIGGGTGIAIAVVAVPPGIDAARISSVVRQGGIYHEILEEAAAIKADLIVMTSHRPAMRTYFLGSNAGHVVRYAKCSVLVVRH